MNKQVYEAINEFIEYLKNSKEVSKNTEKSYKGDLLKLCNYLITEKEIKYINDITSKDILDFFKLELTNKSTSTINRSVASIRGFSKFCNCNSYTKSDFASELNTKKVEIDAHTKALTDSQIKTLYNSIRSQEYKKLRDVAIIDLMITSGIKVSELTELTINDIDFYNNVLYSENRVIKLNKNTIKNIRNYIGRSRDILLLFGKTTDVLFLNHCGDKLSRQGVWKILDKHSKNCGLAHINPNILRDTYIINLLSKGKSIETICEDLKIDTGRARLAYLSNNK